MCIRDRKNNHENIVKECSDQIHNDDVEKELSKHKEWRNKTNLVATPTILVNGFELPNEYEIEDLAMIVDANFEKQ